MAKTEEKPKDKTKESYDPVIKKIAERIRDLRKTKTKKSVEDFAIDNGLNRVQYWRLEKGINFTIVSLLKVLTVHKMSLSEFFKDINETEI
jgi:transcriptional regulator with XRE-family HTH domain